MSEPFAHLMTPEQRRRATAEKMAQQWDRNYPQSVPDDSFLAPNPQGPAPMPRNAVADWLRERGMTTYADRLNDPTSGIGLAVDAVAGLGNAAIVEPVNSWMRMLNDAGTGQRLNPEDAFNVAGAAMMGGIAAPRPRNSLGTVSRTEATGAAVNALGDSSPLTVTAYRGAPGPDRLSPPGVKFYSDRPEIADLYARNSAQYGERFPWADNEAFYTNAERNVASPFPTATNTTPVYGRDIGYGDGSAIARRELTFQNPYQLTGEEINQLIRDSGGMANGMAGVLPDLIGKAKSSGHDGIVIRDMNDIGGRQNQYITFNANGGRPGAALNPLFAQYYGQSPQPHWSDRMREGDL